MVLDEPVTGIAPAALADPGRLDLIAASQLRKTLFTAVGYGTEVRKPDAGPQKPTPMSYPLIRRYVEMPGPEADPADPADQRQRQGQRRYRWHLLR